MKTCRSLFQCLNYSLIKLSLFFYSSLGLRDSLRMQENITLHEYPFYSHIIEVQKAVDLINSSAVDLDGYYLPASSLLVCKQMFGDELGDHWQTPGVFNQKLR